VCSGSDPGRRIRHRDPRPAAAASWRLARTLRPAHVPSDRLLLRPRRRLGHQRLDGRQRKLAHRRNVCQVSKISTLFALFQNPEMSNL